MDEILETINFTDHTIDPYPQNGFFGIYWGFLHGYDTTIRRDEQCYVVFEEGNNFSYGSN